MVGRALHLNLDDAWRDKPLGVPAVDARAWGPRLRFSAPQRLVAEFYREHETDLASPFLLYGSGDFHYLTALRLRRIAGPFVLVSFDNHPDWDVRPPKWGCGGWINRALELSNINRERLGLRKFRVLVAPPFSEIVEPNARGVLDVHPWADDRPCQRSRTPGAICAVTGASTLTNFWKRSVEKMFMSQSILTVSMRAARVTNWEAGRFTVADLEWALGNCASRRGLLRRCLWCLFAQVTRVSNSASPRNSITQNPVAGSRSIHQINLAALKNCGSRRAREFSRPVFYC